jgi:hypothetical protein
MKRIVMLASIAAIGTDCLGQAGVLYRLHSGSELTTERCLPPCACPSGSTTGPLDGTFTLTKVSENPLWVEYSVTGADWLASVPFAPTHVRGEGTYRIGGEVALMHQMDLMLVVSDSPISNPIEFTSTLVGVDPGNPFPRIGITIVCEQVICTRYTIRLVAAPLPCQADCDASGSLSGNDFMCFLNKFAAGDPYANCDGSTGSPRLTGNDFLCYLNRYAAGCP